jgi:thioredoxin-like negative regulator of GroEL
MIVLSASWCHPCTSLKDELARLKNDYPMLRYQVLDVERHPEYVDRYNIQSVPFIIFRDANGNDLETYVGSMSAKTILKKLGIGY